MGYVFYKNDYGPLTANVFDVDGVTPVTPLSGEATIVNVATGLAIIDGALCQVGEGTITYVMPPDSDVTANPGKYTVYLTAEIDETTKNTTVVSLDVLDKGGYGIVERWRRKVEFAAPEFAPDGSDPVGEAEGRDWIDQAVDLMNKYEDTGYVSTLGTVVPTPSANDGELIASVAALMARTAWWAGKGNWRDDEMSFDGTPFEREWRLLETKLSGTGLSGWFDASPTTEPYNMYNRDKADMWGIPDQPDDYFDQVWINDQRSEL